MFKERNPQLPGESGSLKWIQRVVEHNPALLTDAIRAFAKDGPSWEIEFVSPRASDEWAEYRDAGFLLQTGHAELVPALAKYWPRGGPQWDALGRSPNGGVVLVEAKAHFAELSSSCGAGLSSLSMIDAALNESKRLFGASPHADWLQGYYQYANRLAHLKFLRDHGVAAILAFVYFCGDSEMRGPATPAEWESELAAVYGHLGVPHDLSTFGVVNVFIPVLGL